MKGKIYFKEILKLIWSANPLSTLITLSQYILAGISGSLSLLLMGSLINVISSFHENDINEAKMKVILYIIALALLNFSDILFEKFSQIIREKQIFAVQLKIERYICEKVLHTPNDIIDTHEFQEKFKLVTETNSSIYLLISYIAALASAFFKLIVPLILLAKLSLVLLIPFVILTGIFIFLSFKIRLNYWSMYISKTPLRREKDYFTSLFNSADNLSIMKSYNSEEFFINKLEDVIKKAFQTTQVNVIKQNKRYIFLQLVILILPILISMVAVYSFIAGKIIVGDVIMYVGLGMTIHSAILSFGWNVRNLQDLSISMNTFIEFITEEVDDNKDYNKSVISDMPDDKLDICVDNVSFKYPNMERPALVNLNLNIQSGRKIAIVGENGSGKTTFIKILLGLYKNYDGKITINGKDLRSIPDEWLATNISPCFQDYLCPKFLLREAIGMSDTSQINNDDNLNRSLELTNAIDLLKQMDFDSQLGTEFSEGINVSMGQWQKIALSRAYFKDNSALVLDEPMASLDIYSEKSFYDMMIKKDKEQKLSLFISHRMLGIRACDQIFVFDKGQVIESGNHEYLIGLKGKYFNLYTAQEISYQYEKDKEVVST